MMKTNKEIIIEELKKSKLIMLNPESTEEEMTLQFEETGKKPNKQLAKSKLYRNVATTLLSKLQTLDRDEVNSIMVKLVNNWKSISGNSTEDGRKRYAKKKKAIDQICQLIPKEKEE